MSLLETALKAPQGAYERFFVCFVLFLEGRTVLRGVTLYLVAREALGWLLLCVPLDQSFSYFAGTEFSLWIKPQPASNWQPWVIYRAQMLLRYMSVYLKGSRSEKLSGRLILCEIWWEQGREIVCTWECKPGNETLSVSVSSCLRWGTDIYIRGLWGLVVKDACEIVKYITDTHTHTQR